MGGAIGLLVSDIIGLILMMPPSEYDEEGYKKSINIGLVTLFVANPIACFLGAAIGDGSGDNYPINYDYNQFQATKRQLSKRALH